MQRQRLSLTALISLLGLAACSPSSHESSAPPAAAPTSAVSVVMETPSAPAPAPIVSAPAPAKPVAPGPAASAPAALPSEPPAPAPRSSGNTLTQEQAIALATRSNCLVCHRIEGRLAGPSWKAVGDKYKHETNPAAIIAANIRQGGRFGWNMGVMPPKGGNASLSDADIASLAGFIASLR
jgi:cytochrome c